MLDTSAGVLNTALGERVAQESNTGALAGLGRPPGRLFGVQMPIVASFNAGNSWLMYKMLLAQPRPVDQGLDAGISVCGNAAPPATVFVGATAPLVPMSDAERARLSPYILGNAMPYPLNLPPDEPTPVAPPYDESSTLPCTFDELERIRAWITQGANVEACGACPE